MSPSLISAAPGGAIPPSTDHLQIIPSEVIISTTPLEETEKEKPSGKKEPSAVQKAVPMIKRSNTPSANKMRTPSLIPPPQRRPARPMTPVLAPGIINDFH